MKGQEQFNDLILDMGVSIPLGPIFGFTPRLVMRAPYAGTLLRISRLYLSMGIEKSSLDNMSYEQIMELHIKYGKTISKMVALAILRGYWSGKFLTPVLAFVLIWLMKPTMLHEAWYQLLNMLDTRSFIKVIKSADQINLMKPRLSQQKKGS